MTETINNIVDAIRQSSTVLVVRPKDVPDGDAVGSSLGMAAFEGNW